MFERFTEKARRVIFFARYEASEFGSSCIDSEHLLLGLLREDKRLPLRLKIEDVGAIRSKVEALSPVRPKVATTVDLPLSEDAKRVLQHAAEEADDLKHRHIGTEHLLLGIFRTEQCRAAELLREYPLNLDTLRAELGKPVVGSRSSIYSSQRLPSIERMVEIHGGRWDAEYIRQRVNACSETAWHWQQQAWHPRDIAVDRRSGRISFELKLADDSQDFDIVAAGCKKDHCAVCRWELTESADPSHAMGYTNGHDWLCTECYERFWENPNFFASNYSDIT